MYMWFDWVVSPKVNAQIAEYFGEAPANAKACELTADEDHCDIYHADDEEYFDQVSTGTPRRRTAVMTVR